MRLSIFAIAVVALAAVCFADDDNTCKAELEYSDGTKYTFDLSGLQHPSGKEDMVARDSSNENTYYINICGQVSTQSQAECRGASVCQHSLSGDYKNAGTLSSQKFKVDDDDKPGEGIVVYYGGGDACSGNDIRQSSIYIECDAKADDPIFSAVEEVKHCSYKIKVSSKYGCGKKSGSGGGGGDTAALVILLILIFGFILYFGLGVLYQKKVKGAESGRDLIIHNEFWCALPGLVKDGVLFITHGCKKGDYVSV